MYIVADFFLFFELCSAVDIHREATRGGGGGGGKGEKWRVVRTIPISTLVNLFESWLKCAFIYYLFRVYVPPH